MAAGVHANFFFFPEFFFVLPRVIGACPKTTDYIFCVVVMS